SRRPVPTCHAPRLRILPLPLPQPPETNTLDSLEWPHPIHRRDRPSLRRVRASPPDLRTAPLQALRIWLGLRSRHPWIPVKELCRAEQCGCLRDDLRRRTHHLRQEHPPPSAVRRWSALIG